MITIHNKEYMYESIKGHLPPSSLHLRNSNKVSEPLYLAGMDPVPCNGRKCPAPLLSTKTVHSGPVRGHSLDICWNNVDTPGGKQR